MAKVDLVYDADCPSISSPARTWCERSPSQGPSRMAAPIVLSVGTGYLFSVGTTFFFEEDGQFFEAAAVLLVFVLLGHWLVMRARAGASSTIKALINLTPAKERPLSPQRASARFTGSARASA